MKRLISKIIGVSDLIERQERTNKLLEVVVELQKIHISNQCKSFSDRYNANHIHV